MANATETPKPDEVGWLFVQQYYTMMNKKPGNLHLFYKSKSSFVHGMEGEQVKLSQGQQEIHDRISDLALKDCRVLVSNVDSQGSLEGGILIQVLGEISNNGQESKKFAQTFSLAPQESGFYVYNDIFRFLKEDVESDFGDDQHFEPSSTSGNADLPEASTEKDTLFSHEVTPSQAAAVVTSNNASTPEPNTETAPKNHFPGSTSNAVAEIEKAAEESEHAPTELAQEVVASPAQTPVAPAEQPEKVSQPSEAVEAIAKPAEKQAEPAKPSAPMSWAARAAANAATKAQSPATSKPAPPKTVPSKTTTPSVTETEKKPTSSGNAAVADVTRSAFLKNISPKMTDDAIRTALKKFGDFKNVEINRTKSCGFVDYLEAASCAAAIKANSISINGETFLVEERRRDSNGKIGPKEKRFDQGKENRGETSRGGRGGRQNKSTRGAANPK
ncbi:Putative G3BP-like protein [Taphrina deformans PYCC 5710]|uniref:G3BP-like protein n=1 Tax=Taphrina deformans (strain PYCC 5710 / ATCC 11124 / CBS 356.35 / IMI 108563 / JCM 9778 / NBRC 8474) TaxID=1097556 RepID=R4X6Q2_TAPDE|nr:Putative G3BP-like protein [Taphrina deformans PYCC 5710]|eukprot:CCG80867.1 Putative G3BP-like protein [Taphrina deformans PYCC 5710]